MSCFIENLPMMKQAAETTESAGLKLVPQHIVFELWNCDFIKSVEKEKRKLDPLCTFIDYVQSQDCSLADSIHKWLQMDTIDGHFQKWLRRDDMICDLPSLMAYSLHPKYKGDLLSQAQKEKVTKYIYKNGRGELVLQQFEEFLTASGNFGDECTFDLNAESYWKLMQFEKPEISELALTYVSLPASTASLERVFSMWDFVHSKSRNRLSESTSEKLIFVYHASKTISIEALMKIYV